MKKFVFSTMVALIVLGLATIASARPLNDWFCSYHGKYYSELSQAEREDVLIWQEERIEQRRQVLQERVNRGRITQEQADRNLKYFEERLQEGYYGCGPADRSYNGSGRGPGHGRSCCW